jgi:hypothetical protein
MWLTFQESFYDPTAHSGYLENYIRNKRSRDPEITTTWTVKKRYVTITVLVFVIGPTFSAPHKLYDNDWFCLHKHEKVAGSCGLYNILHNLPSLCLYALTHYLGD